MCEYRILETYLTVGLDDGTLIYSLDSHEHVSSFVCSSAVSDICLPQLSSLGHFLVRDISGQVYQLFINIAKVPERSVSIKVSQAFRNIKTLLKFRRKESMNEDQTKNASTQNNLQFKVHKQECRLIASVPSWSPSAKGFSEFLNPSFKLSQFLQKMVLELRNMNICGHTSTTIPTLVDCVRVLLEEGLVTSKLDRFVFFAMERPKTS